MHKNLRKQVMGRKKEKTSKPQAMSSEEEGQVRGDSPIHRLHAEPRHNQGEGMQEMRIDIVEIRNDITGIIGRLQSLERDRKKDDKEPRNADSVAKKKRNRRLSKQVPKNFPCPLCEKFFASGSSIKTHLDTKHGIMKSLVACEGGIDEEKKKFKNPKMRFVNNGKEISAQEAIDKTKQAKGSRNDDQMMEEEQHKPRTRFSSKKVGYKPSTLKVERKRIKSAKKEELYAESEDEAFQKDKKQEKGDEQDEFEP